MQRIGIALVVAILAGPACSDRSYVSPIAPRVTQPPPAAAAELATVSGQIYLDVDWGEPPIEGATIEVIADNGSTNSALSDEDGFYAIAVRPGNISITASKEGYEAKTWQLTLLNDTVLNFRLTPN
jgi:hypothetical protein